MKKIYYFLMAAFVAVCMCTACSSGDENGNDGGSNGDGGNEKVENVNSSDLIGTWWCTKEVELEIYEEDGKEYKDEYKDTYDNPKESWCLTFFSDGTGVGSDLAEDSYEHEKFKWTISGNLLEIKYGNIDKEEYKVEKFNSTQIVIFMDEKDSEDDYYYKETYTYKRVGNDPKSIAGTWYCVAYEGFEEDEGGGWRETYDSPEDDSVIIFFEDGVGKELFYIDNWYGSGCFDWTLSKGILTMTTPYNKDDYKMESFTSTQFVISYEWESDSGVQEYEKLTYQRIE